MESSSMVGKELATGLPDSNVGGMWSFKKNTRTKRKRTPTFPVFQCYMGQHVSLVFEPTSPLAFVRQLFEHLLLEARWQNQPHSTLSQKVSLWIL